MTAVPLAEDFAFRGPVASFTDAAGYREMAAQAGAAVRSFRVRHQFSDGDPGVFGGGLGDGHGRRVAHRGRGSRDPRRCHRPALIVRIAPAGIHLGCGQIGLTGAALAAYRAALHDLARVSDLDRYVTALLVDGAELSDPTRRRIPAGFDRAGPAARFAVRDGFHVVRRYPRPTAVTAPGLVDWCADRLAPFAPVHQRLASAG
jgi:hypothetical protein